MKIHREKIGEVLEELLKRGAVEKECRGDGLLARLEYKGSTVNLYKTGSITVGGKEKERREVEKEIEKILETKIAKLSFPLVGCDEVGKGERVGPLVVACVLADRECYLKLLKLGVKDSKRLKREKIREIAKEIRESCIAVVRAVLPEEYNRRYERLKNQNRLLEEIYAEAIEELLSEAPSPYKIVIDKFSGRAEEFLKKRCRFKEIEAREKAEEEPVVAAAAIVAKDEWFRIMEETSEEVLPKFVKEHFKESGNEKG